MRRMIELITEPVFITVNGGSGETKTMRFDDASYTYLGRIVKQSFEDIFIENQGPGTVRIAFEEHVDAAGGALNGVKTLKNNQSISFKKSITYIKIYFQGDAIVDLVLKVG